VIEDIYPIYEGGEVVLPGSKPPHGPGCKPKKPKKE